MRFLLDQNQSIELVQHLGQVGLDAVHTRNIGLSRSSDAEVLAFAKADGRVLISADTDFGELLARSRDVAPSVLLLRRQGRRRAVAVAELIQANLIAIEEDLVAGAIVVFDQDRLRVRRLPVRRPS